MKMNHEAGTPLHLGAGIEARETSPFLGTIDKLFSTLDKYIEKAIYVLLNKHKNDKKFAETMNLIDFEYVTLLLKKLLQKVSQVEKDFENNDFYLDRKSVLRNEYMVPVGLTSLSENTLEINFNKSLELMGKESSQEQKHVLVQLVAIIIHEAVHLLTKKDKDQRGTTGFLEFEDYGEQNESLNEAMTEIIARGITRSYFNFKKDFTGEIKTFNPYQNEIERLVALMILVARDTNVTLDAVIQAFTLSYFHGDDVLNYLSEIGKISPEANTLIDKLRRPVAKNKTSAKEVPFSIKEIGDNPEIRNTFTGIFESSLSTVVAKALQLL